MGCSRFLKEKNPAIQVIGVQPAAGARSRASASGPRNTCRRYSSASASIA